jgi:hypothetical protein
LGAIALSALADLIRIVHFLWVLAIVLPIPLIWIGSKRNWSWIRNPVYRLIHLSMIGIVVAESVLGAICPLTLWENVLRKQDLQEPLDGSSFIADWVGRVLYFDFPAWIFTSVYILMGAVIALQYVLVPPRKTAGSSLRPGFKRRL